MMTLLNQVTLLLRKRLSMLRIKRSEIMATKLIRKDMWFLHLILNLVEDSLLYFKIFSDQETCDFVISTAGINF